MYNLLKELEEATDDVKTANPKTGEAKTVTFDAGAFPRRPTLQKRNSGPSPISSSRKTKNRPFGRIENII